MKTSAIALAFIALLGVVTGYVVMGLTAAEVESDTQVQVSDLCNAPGWPPGSELAYRVACKRGLGRK